MTQTQPNQPSRVIATITIVLAAIGAAVACWALVFDLGQLGVDPSSKHAPNRAEVLIRLVVETAVLALLATGAVALARRRMVGRTLVAIGLIPAAATLSLALAPATKQWILAPQN